MGLDRPREEDLRESGERKANRDSSQHRPTYRVLGTRADEQG